MSRTVRKNFAVFHHSLSCALEKPPPSGEEQSEQPGTLKVYIALFLFILIFIKITLPKRKQKPGYASYSDTLPYLQWIPFVRLPLLDGLISLYKLRKDGYKFIKYIFEKYGPNVRMSNGLEMVIGISDPKIIQKLLSSTKPGHLRKSQFLYNLVFTNLLKDGLVAAKVDTWSHHRKVLSPAFKYNSFATYFEFINRGAREIMQSACNGASKDKVGVISNQEMREIIEHHLVQIVMQMIMGTNTINFSKDQRISFHQSFQRFKDIVAERMYRLEQMIPFIWWLHPNKKQMDQEIKNIDNISTQIADSYRKQTTVKEKDQQQLTTNEIKSQQYLEQIKERKVEAELGIKSFDCLVELMIKSGFSNKEVTDEVATFLIAGHETVKTALDLLIFQLAGNPDHQEKCRTEIDNLFDSKNFTQESCLGLEDFTQLKYLEMCILESMRLTPTISAFLRHLEEPLRIDDNYIIPAGEHVAVMTCYLHRNPEIYPNPEKYDPTRFLPENVKQRHPYSFIPFSLGMRNCIGWKIALLEIKIIMAWILRHFELDTTDGPNDVKLLFDVTLKPERPYNATFKKREM